MISIPTYFRACIWDAAHREPSCRTYASVGRTLADGIEEYVTEEALEELDRVADDDYQAVMAWFRRHLVEFYSLVPPKRRRSFVEGFLNKHRQ